MRKQPPSGSRQRRRAASPARAKDPFHNGQTPACGGLLLAVQDVFPELQQQMQKQTPSSDLGQLLRWQFLENRKARRLPPPPPPFSSSSETNQQDGPAGGTSTKKKKRKKKKKKQDAASNVGEQAGGDSVAMEDQNNKRSLDQSVASTNKEMDHSDIALIAANSGLNSMPSDLSDFHDESNPMNSSALFFEQILPQQNDESMLSPTQFIKQIQPQKEAAMAAIPSLVMDSEDDDDPGAAPRTPNRPTSTPSAEGLITPSHSQSAIDETVLNSPTHEWVPEESAESKVETPPCDAIKDPLTLPFLLTLSEENGGMTTTTIDGTLVAAAHAIEEGPNKVETQRLLFEEWLEQLDHHQKENRKKDYKSFLDFLQARIQGGSQPLGIPFQTLQDACMNVACYSCRQEATTEVEKLLGEGKPIVLNESCLQEESKAQTNAAVDSAFDYVALEEGHHNPAPQAQEKEPDLTKSLSFVASDRNKGKGSAAAGKPILYLQKVTQKHLDTLAEHWLPCGIEEDVMVTTVVKSDSSKFSEHEAAIVLDENELRVMQQNVLENEKDIRDSLAEIAEVQNGLTAEIGKTVAHSETMGGQGKQNVEFKVFPILKQSDVMGMSLFAEVLTVLKNTTNDQHHALPDLQMYLWTSYLQALDKAIKACETYYNEIEGMTDQRGTLPKMFVSAELREAFKTLVEEKTKAWTELCHAFSRNLTSRVVKEYYTRDVWHYRKNEFKPDPLDSDCHELVKILSGWAEIVLGGKMQEIVRERLGQTNEVLALLQKIIEPLAKEYASVERYFSADRNVYFANLRSQIVLVLGVKERMRLLDPKEVVSMAISLILMWRHTRIMQSRMVTSKDTPTLPLQLKRWMLQDERDFDEWRNPPVNTTTLTHHQMSCRPGIGGKRRVMCVLASLVYKWLGDRCMEWKAEMAEKELLTDFMAESSSVANVSTNGENNNQNKSGKKKKKKKKGKTAPSPQNVNGDGKTAAPIEDSSLKMNGTHKMQVEGNEKPQTKIESKSDEVAFPQENEAAHTNGEATEAAAENALPEDKDDAAVELSAAPYADIDDFPTSVYVQDDKDLISARDFLASRLRELLEHVDGNVVVIQQ